LAAGDDAVLVAGRVSGCALGEEERGFFVGVDGFFLLVFEVGGVLGVVHGVLWVGGFDVVGAV
jgi:hypothetical protein